MEDWIIATDFAAPTALPPKPAVAAGMHTEWSHGRRGAPSPEVRPQCDAGYKQASAAHGGSAILGAGSLDARSRDLAGLALGKYIEAAIIAILVIFNAVLGLFLKSHTHATLAALKSRLALNAADRRDGAWKTLPAAELVQGNLVKLSLGGMVAADVTLIVGEVQLDHSMLTGESMPVEASAGTQTYAEVFVRRGEAEAKVTATGLRTKFGRTAELVRTAHVASSEQIAVLRVVRNLALFNGVVIAILVAYAWFLKMPVAEIIPLVLTAVLASIPVALPATLAAALGAQAVAILGILSTRLSAVDEASSS